MVAKLANDVDDSLRRNAAATDTAFSHVKEEIVNFDLRVAINKDDFDFATEATRTRVVKMDQEFQGLLATCRDSFEQIQTSSKAFIDDTNRQLAGLISSGSGGGFGGSAPLQHQERDH